MIAYVARELDTGRTLSVHDDVLRGLRHAAQARAQHLSWGGPSADRAHAEPRLL